jgi:hypothetical protein
MNMKYWYGVLIVIALFAGTTLSAQAASLTVSGIATPAAANGTYLSIGTVYGYSAWKLTTSSQSYYITSVQL